MALSVLENSEFQKIFIKGGDFRWGDFDLIFPILDLYENKLDRRPTLQDL